MADFFKDKALVDGFSHTRAWMEPAGEIRDSFGNPTFLRVETGIHSGDTTWFTTIGSLDRTGRIVDIYGNSTPLQLAPPPLKMR